MIVAIGANTSCTSINSLMSMNSIIKNIPVLNQTLLNIDCDPPILFFFILNKYISKLSH